MTIAARPERRWFHRSGMVFERLSRPAECGTEDSIVGLLDPANTIATTSTSKQSTAIEIGGASAGNDAAPTAAAERVQPLGSARRRRG